LPLPPSFPPALLSPEPPSFALLALFPPVPLFPLFSLGLAFADCPFDSGSFP
jgi:hypothetical protein